jgi:putative nucleotidyltransferase with HDIG domain
MTFQNNAFVLAADSDEESCKRIADCLSSLHVKTAVALNPQQLVEMLSTLDPHVVIVDYQLLKADNFSLIEIIKKERLRAQVVVTADTADVKIAVDAIKRGAADFLAKPFDFNEFESKIIDMLKTSGQGAVPEVFSDNEFSGLYNILKKISTTDNVDSLSTVVFDSIISISGADSGAFHIYDKDKHELVTTREYGRPDKKKIQYIFSDSVHELIADFSATSKHSALLYYNNDGEACTYSDVEEINSTLHEICVPINIGGDRIGVISLFRDNVKPGFSGSDLKMIEVVASQAGASAFHAGLYVSINRKIEELMLISNFSEQLMGMVDKYDIIRTLYSATVKYLPIDVIGFLVVQKRAHEFLYWVRNSKDSSRIESICAEVVDAYNKSYSMSVSVKRVLLRTVNLPEIPITESDTCSNPEFKHILPVAWEDFRFGAFYFESARKLENKAENTALLSNLVNQARIALTNSRLYSDIKENYIRTIKALAIAVDAKDTYTHGHSENVMNIAEEIAREMNLDEKNIGIIRDAGLLHDIGKIGIPGQILNKPGPLTYEEFNGIMKTHSSLGANIVRDVPFLQGLYKLILHHHEHFDGSGYPDGIKGEQIPLGARILHVADAFEAMTSNRPYRTSLGEVEALRRLVAAKSTQFDPVVIDAFLRFAYRKYKIKL